MTKSSIPSVLELQFSDLFLPSIFGSKSAIATNLIHLYVILLWPSSDSWKIQWSRKGGSMKNGHWYLGFWEIESLGVEGGEYKCQGLWTAGKKEIQFRLLCRVTSLRVYCFACRLRSVGNKYLQLRAWIDNEHPEVRRHPQVFGESSYNREETGGKKLRRSFSREKTKWEAMSKRWCLGMMGTPAPVTSLQFCRFINNRTHLTSVPGTSAPGILSKPKSGSHSRPS